MQESPSDSFLFPNLKKDIRGRHFQSDEDEEVMAAVEVWFHGKDPDFFTSGLIALEYRWSLVQVHSPGGKEGNYIEKEELDLNPK